MQTWIGLKERIYISSLHPDNKFVWVRDGLDAWVSSAWSNWHPNDPNNGGCGRILDDTGVVADIQCTRLYPGHACEGGEYCNNRH